MLRKPQDPTRPCAKAPVCLGLLLALALLALAALPGLASADVQTIEFDAAPPALGSPLDSQGDVSFPAELGFRPYRTEVGPQRAHSGGGVGDLGRCVAEAEASGKNPGACETFTAASTGLLARTASSVRLFAGRFGPTDPSEEPEQALLHAYDAAGNPIGTAGPVTLSESFDAPLEVTSPTGQIASFRVEATIGFGQAPGPDLGIDDLSVNFAGGGKPDFGIATGAEVVGLVQGQSNQVPVQINRLNGSNGPIELTVSGLPQGVSAAPVTVQGAQTKATIVLSAAPNAPDTNFEVSEATIEGDPLGDPSVGPGPRGAGLLLRVGTDFVLSGPELPVEVPDCAPLDVPIEISRNIAFASDITLSVRGEGGEPLPPGVSAEILPSPVISHGDGDLLAKRTLRLRADPAAELNQREFGLLLDLRAQAGTDGAQHRFPLQTFAASSRARIATAAPGSGHGYTPRLGGPGSRVRIRGTGFCQGTTVEVGNPRAIAPATLVNDRTIEFEVPRYANNGPVTIIPPDGLRHYRAEDRLTVDSFRNTQGFQFANYPFGSLSLGELTEAFGADELFVSTNPCWPFGECRIRTSILDPVATIDWGVLNLALRYGAKAHCFGMSLASEELQSGIVPFRRLDPPPNARVFDLGGPDGPSERLNSFLDAEQAKQGSNELIAAWYNRDKSLQAQLNTIEREFHHGREPLISLQNGARGHTVLAYDMAQTPQTAEIYVYDSQVPFAAWEGEDITGAHREAVDESVIYVDKARKSWRLYHGGANWTGGDHGTLWAQPHDAVPADPSLPGESRLREFLATVTFGSAEGSVRTRAGSPGAEFLPTTDGAAAGDGASGTWVTGARTRPLRVTFEGTGAGTYTQAYTAPGFTASAADVRTAEGVTDTVTGSRDSLSFASGRDRPLRIELARRTGAAASTAVALDTHASAEGADTAGIAADGALTYAHDGAPTAVGFSLTTVRRDGGPATFVSGPLHVGRGERLRATPLDRDLRRVRLSVRGADGRESSRVLRNRGRAHGRLAIGPPRLASRRLSMRVALSGLHGPAILGATLRLMRGGHLVARRAVALRGAHGAREIAWSLPRPIRSGNYRLLADIRAIATAARGGSVAQSASAHRAAKVTIGGN